MEKNIVYRDCVIEQVDTPDGKATIVKRFKDERLEINIYHLKADQSFYLKAPKSNQGIKTYQIVSGALECLTTHRNCEVGDMIVLNHGDGHFFIKALENSQLLVHSFNEEAYESTYKNFEAVHKVLLKIQEKDNYTNEHNRRVHGLTHEMAIRLGYEGDKLHDLNYAARYHDVGKIFIPDEILNKPSKLSAEEYEVMKTHVTEGKHIIKEYFNDNIFEIMVQHHERLDGSGYPYGLRADQIREEAKILAVLDSFDAMTSDRVYKKGMAVEAAIGELYALCGTHYEKKYVDLLVQIVKEKK